jgi:metal-responsive CopG/Arc/MetJ family transcriptional regulator
MVGVRLPPKMLKKIARVADALGSDRSTAIRSILEHGLGREGDRLASIRKGPRPDR